MAVSHENVKVLNLSPQNPVKAKRGGGGGGGGVRQRQ